ncbi:hypothetical protein [Actinomadura gamaensis]|uniref:Secreted protein n=1 Tax=Actinomadura gamaensis TaxID=1763541 RepID=A0ABV9TUR1_9ACTN
MKGKRQALALVATATAFAVTATFAPDASANLNNASGPVGFGEFKVDSYVRHKTSTGAFRVHRLYSAPCSFDSCDMVMELVYKGTHHGICPGVRLTPGAQRDWDKVICSRVPAGTQFQIAVAGSGPGQWRGVVDY